MKKIILGVLLICTVLCTGPGNVFAGEKGIMEGPRKVIIKVKIDDDKLNGKSATSKNASGNAGRGKSVHGKGGRGKKVVHDVIFCVTYG